MDDTMGDIDTSDDDTPKQNNKTKARDLSGFPSYIHENRRTDGPGQMMDSFIHSGLHFMSGQRVGFKDGCLEYGNFPFLRSWFISHATLRKLQYDCIDTLGWDCIENWSRCLPVKGTNYGCVWQSSSIHFCPFPCHGTRTWIGGQGCK